MVVSQSSWNWLFEIFIILCTFLGFENSAHSNVHDLSAWFDKLVAVYELERRLHKSLTKFELEVSGDNYVGPSTMHCHRGQLTIPSFQQQNQ